MGVTTKGKKRLHIYLGSPRILLGPFRYRHQNSTKMIILGLNGKMANFVKKSFSWLEIKADITINKYLFSARSRWMPSLE